VNVLILVAALASAAAPVARVGGAKGVRALSVLLQRGDEVAGIPCNDEGSEPDRAPDGIFTCGPLPPNLGTVRLGVVRDGALLDAGEIEILGDIAARLEGGVVILGDASILPGALPGAPSAATPTLFVRVSGSGSGPAPVVRAIGPAGAVEVSCRDDGVFPDRQRNDAEHGCAGPSPGARAELAVNARPAGAATWAAGESFHFLTLDLAAGKAHTDAFDLPPFAPLPVVADPVPVPLPPPPEPEPGAPTSHVPPPLVVPETPPPPVAPGDAPAPEAPSHSPVASRTFQTPPLALVLALALGAGGVLAWTRRARALPRSLVPLPAPALVAGGPDPAAGPVALRCDDPDALFLHLLPLIARHRRVVVVGGPDAPPVADGPVYRSTSDDWEEVEASVRALCRAPGPPVAVLVSPDALTDAGAVRAAPLPRLATAVPQGVWLIVVSTATVSGLAQFEVDGPPWSATRRSA
jgi:hypothetical protein